MKQKIAALICMVMCLWILPMSVFAAQQAVATSYSVATLYDDGTLEIFNDLSRLARVPWENERALIKKVVFTVDTPLYPRLFSDCTNLAEITLPGTITEIPLLCFNDCTSLTSITIPASVTSIGERAFSGCKKLSSVTFDAGSQLQTIGIYAFNQCDALASIAIPDTVTSIGDSAFNNCDALASITIPASVTSIGSFAFSDCDVLTEIHYEGSAEGWISIAKGYNAIQNGIKINHTGSCVDDDTNHTCDLCGKSVGTHVDKNNDHVCDYGCSAAIGTHADADTDADHVCDYGCGATLESCTDAENDNNHSCDVCGKADVSTHTYGNAACEAPAACSECGATSGDALGHDWGNWISNNNGTHTRTCANDTNHAETNDCSGGTASCTEKAECSICTAEYGELAAHSYKNDNCIVCGAADPAYVPDLPKTGDSSKPMLWLAMGVLSTLSILLLKKKGYGR